MHLLTIAQIAVSVVIIVLILLQERSSAGGLGIFGGGGDGSFYQTRRGLEKTLFAATIILVIVFAGLALLNLVV